jgi:hypothetical protein
LDGKTIHSGINVEIYNYGALAGLRIVTQTDANGRFILKDLPDGENFQLNFSKDGHVARELEVGLRNGEITCTEDTKGRYVGYTISSCDLAAYQLRLYPIQQVEIEWELQETPGLANFKGTVSKGRVVLSTAFAHDWTRGGWACCSASYRFGSQEMNVDVPDILAFRDLAGRIFLAQPQHRFIGPPSNDRGSVARLSIDYDQLVNVPSFVEFSVAQEIIPGATYLIKTAALLPDQESHFAKLRVLAVK